jgi:hypothetical protein
MSQYLIIFLIVAVFRGVVWVVQKVQQNAKAREAVAAQQGQAQLGNVAGPSASGPELRSDVSVSPETSRPTMAAVRRESSQASGRANRAAQRGASRGVGRGSIGASRGVSTPSRGGARPAATSARARTAVGAHVNPAAGILSASGRAAPVAVPAHGALSSTASRADQREARIDQSSRDIRSMLRDQTTLRRIMLAREILGSPRGLHP